MRTQESSEGSHAYLEVAVVGTPALDKVAGVPHLPGRDAIVLADSYDAYPGGAAANVAVGVARLGHRVGFIGAVGEDEAGRLLSQAFKNDGVDVRGLRVVKGERTPSCFIAVDPAGERMIFALGGAYMHGVLSEDELSLLHGIRALFLADTSITVAGSAADEAHAQGAAVFINPGGLLAWDGYENLKPVLARADVVVASRTEGLQLLGQEDPQQVAHLLSSCGPRTVVVTLGEEGAFLLDGGEGIHVDPFEVRQVRDTTGAGDAFTAGLIGGFLRGLGWHESARLGCAVAAMKVGSLGARTGLPTTEQLEAFIAETDGGGL